MLPQKLLRTPPLDVLHSVQGLGLSAAFASLVEDVVVTVAAVVVVVAAFLAG
jgi:hypothetical protein